MAIPTNIQQGDPDHPGIHNEERSAINANEQAAAAAQGSANTAQGLALTAQGTANAAIPATSGIRVVNYGSNTTTPRPNAAVVWWKGSAGAADPQNAVTGDAIFIPDA